MNTILGEKIEINGDIDVKSGIMIHGKVVGNIIASGTVRTSENSLITGTIKASNAMISGRIKGDISVENKIVLGTKSVIEGNIRAKILVIEEGAKFDGQSNMSRKPTVVTSSTGEKQKPNV